MMLKQALLLFMVCLSLGFVLACSQYKTINIKTIRGGMVTIPYWCQSWEDGCNIYCRVGATGYREIPTDIRCVERNIIDPICADDNAEARRVCNNNNRRAGMDNTRDNVVNPDNNN